MRSFARREDLIEAFQLTPERYFNTSEWPDWLHEAWGRDTNLDGALWRDPGHDNEFRLRYGGYVFAIPENGWAVRERDQRLLGYSDFGFSKRIVPVVAEED